MVWFILVVVLMALITSTTLLARLVDTPVSVAPATTRWDSPEHGTMSRGALRHEWWKAPRPEGRPHFKQSPCLALTHEGCLMAEDAPVPLPDALESTAPVSVPSPLRPSVALPSFQAEGDVRFSRVMTPREQVFSAPVRPRSRRGRAASLMSSLAARATVAGNVTLLSSLIPRGRENISSPRDRLPSRCTR